MQTPPQISVRNVEDSDAARALVQKCVEKLEVFYSRIISCRVMIDVRNAFQPARRSPTTCAWTGGR